MSYTPWMAGAADAAKRANEAARRRDIAKFHAEYAAYRAEELACGYEPDTFEQYLGSNLCSQLGLHYVSAKDAAQARLLNGQSYAQWSYNADQF